MERLSRKVDVIVEELVTQTRLFCMSECRFCCDHQCILKKATIGPGGRCLDFEARRAKEQ